MKKWILEKDCSLEDVERMIKYDKTKIWWQQKLNVYTVVIYSKNNQNNKTKTIKYFIIKHQIYS